MHTAFDFDKMIPRLPWKSRAFAQQKKHRRTIFAAKSPCLFRDIQLRSAVSLSVRLSPRGLWPQIAASSISKKYGFNIAFPFLKVNGDLAALQTAAKAGCPRGSALKNQALLDITPENFWIFSAAGVILCQI